MANLIQVGENENKYFKSKDIKVFPSPFRGTYKSGPSISDSEITFDPEARLNSEANFILPKSVSGAPSYIFDYNTTKNKISFILGGYYFEILNVSDYIEEISGKQIGIILRPITLQDPSKIDDLLFRHDSKRTTNVLGSWEATSGDSLDLKQGDIYCFTGLRVRTSELALDGSDATIILFTEEGTLNYEACLPSLKQGSGANTLWHGEGLKAEYADQTVVGRYNENKADSLFEIGAGTGTSNRKNALEVSKTKTTINTETIVNSSVDISGSLTVDGKATSAATTASDSANTLVTKSYIDNMIGGINATTPPPPAGDGDSYVTAVTQSGAKITTTLKNFDSTVSDSNNAPSASAVKNFVTTTINALDVDEVGATNTYIQKISESDGKISATAKSFSTSISAASDDTTAPTAKAVYDYIESVREGIENKVTSDISSTVGSLKIEAQVGGDGSYLKTIDQANGKITPVPQDFDTAVTANAKNAPTSAAVKTFTEDTVNSKVAGIWTDNFVKASSKAAASSLKSIILDAVYPLGSVYICYSENKLTSCPITDKLGGTWEAIETGKFLVTASTAANSIYRYGMSGGSADAVTVKHKHSFSDNGTTDPAGDHSHTVLWFDTSAHDSKTDNTFRSADSGDGGGVSEEKWPTINTNSAGTHSHPFAVAGNTSEYGEDGTNKNLPPFIAVYMWRRIK